MAPVATSTLLVTPSPASAASSDGNALKYVPDDSMHEVIPNLWLGDYLAASSPELLQQHGITYVLSALRWKPKVAAGVTYMHVEVDDTPDADLLAHLPSCVRFISDALASNQAILVHCQAGVSRSATIVVAYLMSARSLPANEALALVQQARPQASPSETFLAQLALFSEVKFKVSKKDKATRRFYLSRTAEEVMNGDGSPVPLTMLASWPATPSSSTPSTPLTAPKRRIRCKKCRRELATREHMLDHHVGPGTQPSTPYPSSDNERDPMEQRTSLSRPNSRPPSRAGSRSGSRRGSAVGGEKPALEVPPPLPTTGAMPRRRSSASSPLAQELPVPSEALAAPPPLSTPTIPEDAVMPSTPLDGISARPPVRKPSLRRSFGTTPAPGLGAETVPRLSALTMTTLPSSSTNSTGTGKEEDSAVSEDDGDPLPSLPLRSTGLMAGSALNANLPPALAALRSISTPAVPPPAPSSGAAALGSATTVAPSTAAVGGSVALRKKSFNLQMSRIDTSPPSATDDSPAPAGMGVQGQPLPALASVARVADREKGYFSPPILINPDCSGYFLEPMKWMDFLEEGELGGAIYCPNKKCNAKLGNYDWAGVRCGCKEWIVPGFCIHKSKVDEDL